MLHQVYDGGNVDTAYSTFATTIEKQLKIIMKTVRRVLNNIMNKYPVIN